MKTLIIILSLITIMIICYNINKYIFKSYVKTGHEYDWSVVKTNMLMSLTIFPSIFYWMLVLLNKIPAIPEKPPRWL